MSCFHCVCDTALVNLHVVGMAKECFVHTCTLSLSTLTLTHALSLTHSVYVFVVTKLFVLK